MRGFTNSPGDLGSIASYQRLKKWYLIPSCLTLSNIRYVARVMWCNPEKGVVHPLHLSVVAIEKGAFWSQIHKFFYFYFVSCFMLQTKLFSHIHVLYICGPFPD